MQRIASHGKNHDNCQSLTLTPSIDMLYDINFYGACLVYIELQFLRLCTVQSMKKNMSLFIQIQLGRVGSGHEEIKN